MYLCFLQAKFYQMRALVATFYLWIPIYFLPTLLGYRKSRWKRILLVNLLLGWTVIGWIMALLWALQRDSRPDASIEANQKKLFRELDELQQQLASEQLTQEEYQAKRKELLARQVD